jgi:hypothetical protein
MDNLAKLIIIALLAIAKLIITGICLAIGFEIGKRINVELEKKLVKRPVVATA